MNKPRNNCGFTLIELLIVILIVITLIILIMTGLITKANISVWIRCAILLGLILNAEKIAKQMGILSGKPLEADEVLIILCGVVGFLLTFRGLSPYLFSDDLLFLKNYDANHIVYDLVSFIITLYIVYLTVGAAFWVDCKIEEREKKTKNVYEAPIYLIKKTQPNGTQSITIHASDRGIRGIVTIVLMAVGLSFMAFDHFKKRPEASVARPAVAEKNIYEEERARAEARIKILYENCISRCTSAPVPGVNLRPHCEDKCRDNVHYEVFPKR
jgi:hypothetical protein